MYAKFAAAIVCIVLATVNVVAAVRRTPVRTVMSGSSRPTVEMMESPSSAVQWTSAVMFAATFACFLSWGLADYNKSLDSDELGQENLPNHKQQQSGSTQNNASTNPNIRANNPHNIVQFAPRAVSSFPSSLQQSNKPEELSREEFFSQLQDEDYWDDESKDNHSA